MNETTPNTERWCNRNVFAFGLTSFLSDFCHEMVTSFLPQFMQAIGASAVALDMIQPGDAGKLEVKIMDRLTNEDCPFCRMGRHELDHVAVLEDWDVLAIMDLYPATPGHVLVLPKKHIETIYEMPADLGACLMRTAIMVAKLIKEKLSPDGLNLIQSNEIAAGQTVPHFHLHIVPRCKGDSVILQFGHGNIPERVTELERIASLIRSGLRLERKGIL